jgi:hypothetical protein
MAEPDLDSVEVLEERPECVHCQSNRCLNTQDLTIWLFLLMTQPEEREGTRYWFWYLACLMLSRRGHFGEILDGLPNTQPNHSVLWYQQERFVHLGEWTMKDIALHFHRCGLKTRDANTLFHNFASAWMTGQDAEPMTPDWSRVPAPRQIMDHCNTQRRQRRNQGVACSLNLIDPMPWGVEPTPITYTEDPPSGEIPTVRTSTNEPALAQRLMPLGVTTEEPQGEALEYFEGGAADSPMNQEEDASRM